MQHFIVKMLAASNLVQTCIESLIRFGSTRTKLLIDVSEPVPVHLWLYYNATTLDV